MKHIKIIYNSFLWSMTIATLCFKNEWLQMRVNTGLIFWGLFIVSIFGLSVVFKKKESCFNWIFTSCNLVICTGIGMVVYGFSRMKVVPAALLREGIHQTRIPFSQINLVLLLVTILGLATVLVADLVKKNK